MTHDESRIPAPLGRGVVIYIVKVFDSATWRNYIPIAFASAKEADNYCKKNQKTHQDIFYSWEAIPLGKMD